MRPALRKLQSTIRRTLKMYLVWRAAATWSLGSDGCLTNNPNLGSEIISDNGFETWSSATDLTNWTETLTGTSTVNREATDVKAGTYSLRFDVDGSASSVLVQRSSVSTGGVGTWALASVWSKANHATLGRIGFRTVDNSTINQVLTDAWAQYFVSGRATAATFTALVARGASAGLSLYADDYSVKALTLTELFATIIAADAATVASKLTNLNGAMTGIVGWLDSQRTPANFLLAYRNNQTIAFDKCVAGVYTNLVSATSTYVPGASIEIRRTGSTTFQLWYNGKQVGTDQTVNDVGIVSNTRHGLFSTQASGKFLDFRLNQYQVPFTRLFGLLTSNATWTVSGNTIAPSSLGLGSEMITNPEFTTNTTGWIATNGATITRRDFATSPNIAPTGGTDNFGLEVQSGGSGSSSGRVTTADHVVGSWYMYQGRAYSPSGNVATLIANALMVSATGGMNSNGVIPITVEDAWQTIFGVGRALLTAGDVRLRANSATLGDLAYHDAASLKVLTFANCVTACLAPGSVRVLAKLAAQTRTQTQLGVIGWLDSPTSPANFLIAYQNGSQLVFDKCVAGVWTNLSTTTTSFVAGSQVEIRQTAANTFQVWYAGLQRGTDQTVSDAAILAGQYFGLFATNTANSFSELMIDSTIIPFA